MDLKSGYPYWAINSGLMQAFAPLQQDLRCEVLVIGGGITGALVADALQAHGHEVAVVEQRDIGWGSTAASTALLQYEIDTPLGELATRIGLEQALLAYRSCADAIAQLQQVAAPLRDVGFQRSDSLYFASRRSHLKPLLEEYMLRARHGLPVRWLDAAAVHGEHGITAPGAIFTPLAARVDPYRMTYRLLARLRQRGGHVHDRTAIRAVEVGSRQVVARAASGVSIRCRHLVVAAGYASQHWLRQNVARNRSSYALVTDPLPAALLGRLRRTLVWETARPYLYLRSTGDQRLLIGGEDDAIDIPARRDRRVQHKAARLRARAGTLLPWLPLVPAFAWAGTFAETRDGLPFFGSHRQWGPRVQFAMAYGGNGITYSMLGAGLLRAAIERRRHPLAALFSFQRLG